MAKLLVLHCLDDRHFSEPSCCCVKYLFYHKKPITSLLVKGMCKNNILILRQLLNQVPLSKGTNMNSNTFYFTF